MSGMHIAALAAAAVALAGAVVAYLVIPAARAGRRCASATRAEPVPA